MAKRKGIHRIAALMCALLVGACGGSAAESVAAARTVTAVAAPVVDPLLKVLGFCRDNGSDPDALLAALLAQRNGDLLTAAGIGAVLVLQLYQQGIEIPPDVLTSLAEAYQAIEGMQQGLRALDGRGPDGTPKSSE